MPLPRACVNGSVQRRSDERTTMVGAAATTGWVCTCTSGDVPVSCTLSQMRVIFVSRTRRISRTCGREKCHETNRSHHCGTDFLGGSHSRKCAVRASCVAGEGRGGDRGEGGVTRRATLASRSKRELRPNEESYAVPPSARPISMNTSIGACVAIVNACMQLAARSHGHIPCPRLRRVRPHQAVRRAKQMASPAEDGQRQARRVRRHAVHRGEHVDNKPRFQVILRDAPRLELDVSCSKHRPAHKSNDSVALKSDAQKIVSHARGTRHTATRRIEPRHLCKTDSAGLVRMAGARRSPTSKLSGNSR